MASSGNGTRLAAYQERVQQTFQLDPQVKLTLKGQDFTLEFNNRVIKDLLKATEFNALRDYISNEQMENPEFMGQLLWQGLRTHHPDLTLEQTDILFTARHYPYVLNRLRAALDMFLPDISDIPEVSEVADAGDPTQQLTPSG